MKLNSLKSKIFNVRNFMIFLLLFCISSIFLAVWVYMDQDQRWQHDQYLFQNGIEVQGKVLNLHTYGRVRNYNFIYRYDDLSGKQHIAELKDYNMCTRTFCPLYKVDQTIQVLYDPADPNYSIVKGYNVHETARTIPAIAIALFSILTLCLIVIIVRKSYLTKIPHRVRDK